MQSYGLAMDKEGTSSGQHPYPSDQGSFPYGHREPPLLAGKTTGRREHRSVALLLCGTRQVLCALLGSFATGMPRPELPLQNDMPIDIPASIFGRCSTLEEQPQLVSTDWMLQLAHRLGFNLSDTFTGHVELLADLVVLSRVVGISHRA